MAWVIVGLGNPGAQYENTRHNAGRMALSHFAKKNGLREWKEDKKNELTVAKGALGKNLFVLAFYDGRPPADEVFALARDVLTGKRKPLLMRDMETKQITIYMSQ